MESQTDTLKVYKHHQHARVQKEGDDMWISSEDLRTEGSSDEESPSSTTSRGRRTKKNRKQRKSALLDSSKSTSSVASASSRSTESSAKDLGACAGEIEKSAIETNIDLNTERFSVLNNPFFTDIFPDSAASTSGISLGSSDSGMDALNLESRWRPKRGSLKYPILVEGQTTANYLHEIDGFFNEMMSKIRSLKSCSAVEDFELRDMEEEEEEPKLFKHLKNAPAVREKLKYIERLDDEIKETIQVYKAERAERLQVQNEMCNEICRDNVFPERETQLFLELCHFEANGNINTEQEKVGTKESTIVSDQTRTTNTGNFIKRNIELARQGSMASCSLTDEEKRKLEELLVDENDDFYNSTDNSDGKDSASPLDDPDESSDDENYFVSNAYTFHDNDKARMEDINTELEKFTLDEKEKEQVNRTHSSKQRSSEWKDTVLMEQRLKAINAKLDELQSNYGSDQVEDIFFRMIRSGMQTSGSSDTESKGKDDTVNGENCQKDDEQA